MKFRLSALLSTLVINVVDRKYGNSNGDPGSCHVLPLAIDRPIRVPDYTQNTCDKVSPGNNKLTTIKGISFQV